MNTTSEVKHDAARAPSELMASCTQAEGGRREHGGAPSSASVPSAMAVRPSSIRMPSRSTAFASWDLEDDDDKW